MPRTTKKITPATPARKIPFAKLHKAVNRYFHLCDNHTEEVYVKSSGMIERIITPLPYTLEGLSLAAGLSREEIIHYELHETDLKRIRLINEAKLRIQDNLISRALRGENNNTMSVFILKNNFGYRDKSEQELTGKEGEMVITPITVQVVKSKEELNDE